jgi:hypothetical protein
MRRPLIAGATALATTLALSSPASADHFLPESATYDGKPNHGGEIHFKVRNRRVVKITGKLPLPKGQECQYGDDRRIPLRIEQDDPIEDGPFKIVAEQRVNPGTPVWRKLKLRMTGQFSSDAERATGKLNAKVWDYQGKCETRDGLKWYLQRRR